MVIGTTLFIVALLVVFIWVFVEFKRFKHKIFAIFLIVLIIFTYIGFASTIKGKDLDFSSVSGWKEASQLYLSWLGSVFKNFKTLTANAIQMDWKSVNSTIES